MHKVLEHPYQCGKYWRGERTAKYPPNGQLYQRLNRIMGTVRRFYVNLSREIGLLSMQINILDIDIFSVWA